MRHTISLFLQNEAGALTRVAGLFSSRGYNIESLHVAPTQDHTVSRLTLVTTGSDDVIQQICNQLLKLVDVVDLADMTSGDHMERELLLLKLRLEDEPDEALAERFTALRANVLDQRPGSYTVEVTAGGARIDSLLEEVGGYPGVDAVLSVVRSGVLAISHGVPVIE